ncbi:putative competence membrane protein [Peptoclostridium acidaminophilum DSM 3953]|uniref:Putative competence membrane protein n=1 Tax=Peptoclostridium acidaminophilum DSM 3953 TaxID=1286171 RepID=W8T4Q7_PEPAC|nr:ComEC/Rec2 family competence protein [Peptoclostridium acidaminophilum]AHM56744.1 putative competence membrane protein [Peptoclostridium acidaminophilum DSM 3953]
MSYFTRRPIAAIFIACILICIAYTGADKRNTGDAAKSGVNIRGTVENVALKERCNEYKIGPYLISDYGRQKEYKMGDVLDVRGRLKNFREISIEGFDYGRVLRAKGYTYVVYASSIEYIGVEKNLYFYSGIIKARVYKNIEMIFGSRAPFLKGILFGDKSAMDSELLDAFSDTGIMHIFAVSGLHVGITCAMISLLLKKAGNTLRVFGITLFLIMYAFMTGFTPSVTRAALFFIISEIAFFAGCEYDLKCALYATAIVLMLKNPYVIYDAGFLLSFSAVFSVCSFYDLLQKKVGFAPLSMTLSANMMTWPVTYAVFKNVSLISPVANVLVVPLVPLLMAGSLSCIFLSFVSLRSSIFVSEIVILIVDYSAIVSMKLSDMSFASMKVSEPSMPLVIIYYMAAVAFVIYYESRRVKEQMNAAKGYE